MERAELSDSRLQMEQVGGPITRLAMCQEHTVRRIFLFRELALASGSPFGEGGNGPLVLAGVNVNDVTVSGRGTSGADGS